MSIGNSWPIVIEIEPELKKELHAALRKDGTRLKTLLLEYIDQLLTERSQKPIPLDSSEAKEVRR